MESTHNCVDLAAVRAHLLDVEHVHDPRPPQSPVTRRCSAPMSSWTIPVSTTDTCQTLLDELQHCLGGQFA
jgi:hypothetical protein